MVDLANHEIYETPEKDIIAAEKFALELNKFLKAYDRDYFSEARVVAHSGGATILVTLDPRHDAIDPDWMPVTEPLFWIRFLIQFLRYAEASEKRVLGGRQLIRYSMEFPEVSRILDDMQRNEKGVTQPDPPDHGAEFGSW